MADESKQQGNAGRQEDPGRLELPARMDMSRRSGEPIRPETKSGAERLQEFVQKLPLRQRFITLGMFLACVAIVVFAVYSARQEVYQTLYSGMNPEDAGNLANKLKTQKIEYKLESGGTAISVPTSVVDELRIQLAAEGFPQSGKIGFEIFDRTNFGLSEFVEQVNFRRALEGEISRSIASLQEVASARVHLVLSKSSLYKEQEEAAKASVVVKLKTGRGLSRESITGITNMMASAVPGLKAENITIMDVRGKVLSIPLKEDAVPGLSDAEREAKTAIENELNSKVIAILEPHVGAGKVSARTSVDLNQDLVEETSELFDPDKTAVSRRQVNREFNGGSPGVGGVAGVPGNQPAAPQNPSQAMVGMSGERNKQEEDTQFEVPRTVRRSLQPRGQVSKISVAVVVDDKPVVGKDQQGQKTVSYTARTPQEIQKYKDLAMAAVGFNATRGDVVTVENLAFQTAEGPTEEPVLPWWRSYFLEYLAPHMRYLLILLLVLFLYLTMFRPFQRRIFRTLEPLPSPVTGPEAVSPLLLPEATMPQIAGETYTPGGAHLGAGGAYAGGMTGMADGMSGIPAPFEAAGLGPEEYSGGRGEGDVAKRLADVERDLEEQIENELSASEINVDAKKSAVIKKRITQMAQDNPENIAQLLRSWLHKVE